MQLSHAVKRGVEKLDEKHPGWYREIDPETLDMQSVDKCILGQLYDRFSQGKRELDITYGASYGFSVGKLSHISYENRLMWKELKDLWIEEIEIKMLGEELEDAGLALSSV